MSGPSLFEVPAAALPPDARDAGSSGVGGSLAAASSVTHEGLVLRGYRWLRKSVRCKTVLAEPGYGYPSEVPDVIGWTNRISVVVECKATRADFLKDKRKPGRRRELADGGGASLGGLGDERWYLTPRGLIGPAELPEGWGLLEVRGKQIRRVVQAPRRHPHPERLLRERHILASCLAAVQRREEGLSLLPSRHLERNMGAATGDENGRPS